MSDVISEQILLLRARQLDTRALAETYDLYSPRVYRYAYRLLGDACAAEDCVAETFSRFLQALRNGRGPRDYLQAYLFRMAHNWIVDYYRCEPLEEMLSGDLSDGDGVEENASRSIHQQRVRAAMQELTVDQQQVIVLKFLEGWENEEISHALKKPVGAVKSLQHRGLARLHKLLLDEDDEHGIRRQPRPSSGRVTE